MRRAALLAALVLAACTDTTTLPLGSLAEPVAMAVASTSAGPVIFVADATGNELRAFEVQKQLFVRGPNAISPLSIDVGLRPSRLAAGLAPDASAVTHPFVVAAGAAPRLALVDANQQTVIVPPTTPCTATVTATCLPAPATDVAFANGEVFATIGAPQGGGAASLAIFHATWDSGPVLTLDRTFDLTGRPASVAVRTDGTRAYVADASLARITEVNVAGGVTRDLATAAPVTRVVLTPAYTAANGTAHPEGEFLLAILSDGRVETIDVAAGGPVADPFDASQPMTPLDFGSPARDAAFLPCENAGCTTRIQLTATDVEAENALAFVSLGDGTAVAVEPDPGRPSLLVPVTPRAAGIPALITKPSASAATFSDPAHPEKNSTFGLSAGSITTAIGFTTTETWTITNQGVVPGVAQRPATLAAGGTTLTDDDAAIFTATDVQVGDAVDVASLDSTCAAVKKGVTATIAAIGAGTLTLAHPSVDLSACGDTRVVYSVRVPAGSWTVVGSTSGDVGRTTPGTPFTFAGTRTYYPPTSVAPTAPAPAVRVGFTLPTGVPDDVDSTFVFTTTNGLVPVVIGSSGLATTTGGLASAVVAVNDQSQARELVYLAQVGSSSLVQVQMDLASEATGTVIFH